MANPENDALKDVRDVGTYEDEINLMDYFLVLWRRKWFIFLASVLPALTVGLAMFFWPKSYEITYVYDVSNDVSNWNLNEKNYNMLLSRFYSDKNLKKLTERLNEIGLEKYAKLLSGGGNRPERFVGFEAKPAFLDLSKSNITNPEILSQIRDMEASLLEVTITSKSREDLYKISSVIRDNVENIMPLYMAQERSSAYIREYSDKLANIEGGKFDLELALKNNNKILAGLKKRYVETPETKQDNVVLQFNVGEQSQYLPSRYQEQTTESKSIEPEENIKINEERCKYYYLPLRYQIQAAESMGIELEENIKMNDERYEHYKDLLDLNNRIFAEINGKLLSTDYSTEQFKLFLTHLAADCKKPELKDYLSSYIRKFENQLIANKSVTEKPRIYSLARGTVKKSSIVFSAAFIVSIFAAFLREGIEKLAEAKSVK